MNKKTRDFSFQIKAASEKEGTFSGYASIWHHVDSYDERVMPGAFKDTLADYEAKDRKIPVLWAHKHDEPIGHYEVVKEDEKGLYVEGKLLIGDIERAASAHKLLLSKSISGLSIGFSTRESSYDEDTGVRSLLRLDLWEISIVSFPAADPARVIATRAKLEGGELPSIKEFESILRDAGFSRSKAAAIASRGYRSFLRDAGDDADATAVAGLLKKMRGFKISN